MVFDAAGVREFSQVRSRLTEDGVMVSTRPSPVSLMAQAHAYQEGDTLRGKVAVRVR